MTTLEAPLPGTLVTGRAGAGAWLFLFASAMISALLAETKPAPLLIALSLLLSIFALSLSSASEGGGQPPGSSVQVKFSAEDFDWRTMIPYLSAAAALPAEQGNREVCVGLWACRKYSS